MSEHNFEHYESPHNVIPFPQQDVSQAPPSRPDILVTQDNTDSIVYSIIEKFKRRADFGKKKYNTDLDRKDLSLRDWYNHLHEELFDSILYLEKIMQEIDAIDEKSK